MSTGGKYVLETNMQGEKQETYLYNYALLAERLSEKCSGPLLLNLATTHSSFVKKYYKPVVPVSYEFRSDQINDGGNITAGTWNTFSLPLVGDFQCEMILRVRLEGLAVTNPIDRCAFVDFPGHRLMQHVQMEFSGNVVDEYTSNAYNVYYNYFVPADKRLAWLRAVGQETPVKAYLQQQPENTWREERKILNGHQTPKPAHGPLELNIPIIFDFSRKQHASFFSAKVPFGQRFLKIRLAPLSRLFYVEDRGGGGGVVQPTITGELWTNQIFMPPEIVTRLASGTYRSLVRVFKEEIFSVTPGLSTHKCDSLRFPIETLYFGVRPTANTGPTNWWKYHAESPIQATWPVCIQPNQLAFNTVTINTPTPSVAAVRFLSRNTEITRPAHDTFFSVLQPWVKAWAPRDPGLQILCFARDTYTDDPTAFFNVSIEREFVIEYNALVAGDFYIMAYCLNFLEIGPDGIVSIKYKT